MIAYGNMIRYDPTLVDLATIFCSLNKRDCLFILSFHSWGAKLFQTRFSQLCFPRGTCVLNLMLFPEVKDYYTFLLFYHVKI